MISATFLRPSDRETLKGGRRTQTRDYATSNRAMIVSGAILTGLSGAIYWRSRATKVDHGNVNDEWTGSAPSEPEPAAAA